jgi:hypothetical protein
MKTENIEREDAAAVVVFVVILLLTISLVSLFSKGTFFAAISKC